MSTRHHVRSGSYGRKVVSPLTKATRPVLSAKRSSGFTTSTCTSSNKLPSRPSSKSGPSHDSSDEDEYEDMASFLQFCATCEKQIVTPSFSVLYCSEACKRRDSTKSTSLPVSAPASPLSTALNSLPPYRSPTVLRPVSKTYSELSLYELTTDKDSKMELGLLYDSTFGMPTQVRPAFERSSTSPEASRIPSLVPSLDHSPCSSYGAEVTAVDNARPLPRKHSCPHHRGIDLVTPIMACDASDTPEPRRRSAPTCSARQRAHS